jgi:hypothetical protein
MSNLESWFRRVPALMVVFCLLPSYAPAADPLSRIRDDRPAGF